MATEPSEDALLARAVAGDREAIGTLLWLHYDGLLKGNCRERRRTPYRWQPPLGALTTHQIGSEEADGRGT